MNGRTVGDPASTRRRVLVTGGSGFIGRHVVTSLRHAGHEVTVADLDPFPDASVRCVLGDLTHKHVREAVVGSDIDAIVHLAAFTSVLRSIERPADVYRTNVDMTAGLLESARTQNVGTVVLASTNAVVGNVGQRRITELLPLAPLTPYGATKAAAEMLAAGYAGAFGLRTPVIRLTNVYGDGMTHKDSFVPRLMRAAANAGHVEIYGDGEQRRDLVYVADAAAAFTAAVEGWPSGPTIVGGSRSYTVNDLTQAARDATGLPIEARRVDPKPSEMPAVVVDIARARGLGYEPRVHLVEGLRRAWRDFAPADVRRA